MWRIYCGKDMASWARMSLIVLFFLVVSPNNFLKAETSDDAIISQSPLAKGVKDERTPQRLGAGKQSVPHLSWYQSAIPLIKEGKCSEAIPLLEKALQKTPVDIFLKADYLCCLVWTSAYEKAAQFYLKNERDLEKVEYVPVHVARAFYETADYGRARSLYEKAFRLNPSNLEAFKGLIYSLGHLGEYKNAYELIDIHTDKKTVPAALVTFLQAHVHRQEGRNKEAYTLYAQLSFSLQEEGFWKEVQDRRREVISALTKEEIDSLLRDFLGKDLFLRLWLMDVNQYPKAISDFHYDAQQLPLGFLLESAWGYFKLEKYDESIKIYQFILEKKPHSCLARIGLIYPWAAKERYAECYQVLEKVFEEKCFLVEALFAKGFLYEQEKRILEAMEVYEEILKIRPDNLPALNLKIRNMANLGATTLAQEESLLLGVKDPELLGIIDGDYAVDQLRWDNAQEALKIIEEQLKHDPQNLRARWDGIIALRKLERMKEVIEQYEIVKARKEKIPPWVTEAVADAYLYLEKPQEAREHYKITLKDQLRFPSLSGLFYTYQELREWEKAAKTLQEMETFLRQQKPTKWSKVEEVTTKGWYLPYDDRLRDTLDYYETYFKYLEGKGWFLSYQDKLKEAEKYFASYAQKAGMGTGFRSGLAHVYLWRGWPRLALEEFQIVTQADPDYSAALNGMAIALNTLNYKKEARELTEQLLNKFPTNKHIQKTRYLFQVEEMWELTAEAGFVHENSGAEEFWFKSRLREPLSPLFSLFQEVIWQQAADEGQRFTWNRAGVGAEWIVFPELVWRQAVTFEYQRFKNLGYYTNFTWWPTDPLKITLGYDSFRLNLPVRARAQGIEGQSAFLDVYYHESDLRSYGFSSGLNWYSDGNLNTYMKLYYDQNVLNTPDFKIRMGGTFYYGTNQKTDVPYFSPTNDYSLMATAAFQWTHYLAYDRLFRSHIYARLGVYNQNDYGFSGVGGLTYEQVIETSKTFAAVWSLAWDRKVYDGVFTDVWSGFIQLRKNF